MKLPEDVDPEFLYQVLLAREALGSTGIGDGIAIPHVRNPIVLHLSRPTVTLCFLEQPVDFGALDGQPVSTLFTLVSPTVRAHLHLLSRLAFALRHPRFKAAVQSQASREEILDALREAEAAVATPPPPRASRAAARTDATGEEASAIDARGERTMGLRPEPAGAPADRGQRSAGARARASLRPGPGDRDASLSLVGALAGLERRARRLAAGPSRPLRSRARSPSFAPPAARPAERPSSWCPSTCSAGRARSTAPATGGRRSTRRTGGGSGSASDSWSRRSPASCSRPTASRSCSRGRSWRSPRSCSSPPRTSAREVQQAGWVYLRRDARGNARPVRALRAALGGDRLARAPPAPERRERGRVSTALLFAARAAGLRPEGGDRAAALLAARGPRQRSLATSRRCSRA